jgi:hypothetical protein
VGSSAGRIVAELTRRSAEFRGIWELQQVATRFEDHKVLLHPEVGAIELDCQALFTEDGGQTLLVLTAEPRSEAAEKLALLRVVGSQTFVQ